MEKKKSVAREYAEAIAIAVLLALFIRTFVFQAFKIPSGSMLPTLQIGDHLLVNKFIYGVKMPFTGTTLIPISSPEKGDIVVFKFPKDRSTDYIKRVVAVPGDVVQIRKAKVYINGKAVQEEYAYYDSTEIIPPQASPRDFYGPVTIPDGKIFVMGDNRNNSYDSRFWGFVDQKDVLGQATIIYWSWDLRQPLLSLARFTSVRFTRIGDLLL